MSTTIQFYSPFFAALPEYLFAPKNSDERFFLSALKFATNCQGLTSPNPNVGACIVKEGQILAQGATHKAGGDHAESDALKKIGGQAQGAELFVTLEPCDHFGRTGPCSEKIIAAGIKRVVFGAYDPNPQVNGIKKLRDANIKVEQISCKKLQDLSKNLIEPFANALKKKRPWVTTKLALSHDLKISAAKNCRSKISGALADQVVHELRARHDAILIGANTLNIDNPRLTCRLIRPWHESQPARFVLANKINFLPDAHFFDQKSAPNCILLNEESGQSFKQFAGASVIPCANNSGQIDLKNALEKIYENSLNSVLVEPGEKLFHAFVAHECADEIWIFQSPKLLGERAHAIGSLDLMNEKYEKVFQTMVGEDNLQIYRKKISLLGPLPT